jgi:4-hydroxymandelate oxidase
MEPINVDDYEAAARERLPQMVYDYYAGGAEDEATVRENVEAFRRRVLRYRILVDVAERDLSCDLLGVRMPLPIILAPTSQHRLAHPEGEAETARGAATIGALMTVSTVATVSLEDVAAAAPHAPRWFQLYFYGDRWTTELLAKRAFEAGYRAIVLTVDVPVLGRRERDVRNEYRLPEGMTFANFENLPPPPPDEGSELAAFFSRAQSASLNWDHVEWLRSLVPLPWIIKGVVRGDDARRAMDAGFDAVWVSNHGGRQLDGAIASLDALPEVVEAVGGAVPIIVDGGIRRGTDVLKALALGATAAAIGRPQLWGLAVGGAAGVGHVLGILRDELSSAMALAGCRSLADIDRSLIV